MHEGRIVTDARLPERWLNDRRIQQLSPEAFFAFSNALMWSASNRTDGVIKSAELELIPRCKSAHADELTEAGLLKKRRDGWLITDYASTQRSREQLENDDKYRQREAERVRRLRAAQREEITSERTDVRAYVRDDCIGQDLQQVTNNVSGNEKNDEKNDGQYFGEAPDTDADGFPLDVP